MFAVNWDLVRKTVRGQQLKPFSNISSENDSRVYLLCPVHARHLLTLNSILWLWSLSLTLGVEKGVQDGCRGNGFVYMRLSTPLFARYRPQPKSSPGETT